MEATTSSQFVSVSFSVKAAVIFKIDSKLMFMFSSFSDIGNQYQTEYQKAVDTCGDYTKYTNVDSYENLINFKNDILQKIISCESVNITIPGK